MHPERPSAALIAAGGVFVPGYLAEPIWRALREEIRRRQGDGGRVRPEVLQVLDTLRAATLAHLTDPDGPTARTSADLAPRSAPSAGVLPTEALADRLGVTTRHARRLARAEGIAPVRRNCWAAEDVAALAARRHP